ncbi:MAG: 7-cyano-7-deazaguanine synthase QueC [Vampirovibrionia bacterium]
MTSKSAVISLSGGLDSLVSLASIMESVDVKLALFFDYGQRAVKQEENAVKSISEYYNISYKTIKLDWLKDITFTSLVNKDEMLPFYDQDKLNDDISVMEASAKSVWVPNRNGVILNIAAAYADSYSFDYVVFGANKEEATTFPDNSINYVKSITDSFSFSTSNKVQVIAPLAFKTKQEIVDIASSLDVPLQLVWSCYSDMCRHCGKCESCNRLKRALIKNNKSNIWEKLIYSAV